MDVDNNFDDNRNNLTNGEISHSPVVQLQHNGTNGVHSVIDGIHNGTNEMDDSREELSVRSKKPSRMSLISTPREKKEKRQSSTLSAELQTLLSSLYMDTNARMCLTYPLRCAQDLAYCHSKHYTASMPELPSLQQTANLKVTWQQGRYIEFLQTASDMCVRFEFPGEAIFAKLIELILTTASPKQPYVSIGRVFRLFVHTFPPCWVSLRPHYINFFRKTLHIPKLFPKKDFVSQSSKVFDIMFNLIEQTFDDYAVLMKKMEEEPESLKLSQNNSQMETSCIKSQCFSQWNWEDCTSDIDTFFTLKSDARLERINVVMDLLLQILEIDLTMWLLHYYRKPKESIFHSEKTPLVFIVFDMTQIVRLTTQVERLFTLFSKAIAMDLSRTHLKIMERYIALVMIASHTADIENSIMGIRYPCLQSNTKKFIKEFYKIFKSHNTTSLKPFLTVIDLLRIPYVRFEFIDNFLQIFDFSSSDTSMGPGKIINGLKKYWPKYKMQADVSNSDEELSREQFFELLLKALRAYCEMFGLQRVMRYIACGEIMRPLQTVSKSVHHCPNRGRTADVFLLEKMAEDKEFWLNKLRMQVRVARPKIDYPTADICIDKYVQASYRNDLKHCWLLSDVLTNQGLANSGINLNEWQEFAMIFKSEIAP